MASSPLKKGILIVLGSVALGVGILGIFLPLLPTTVFLLMAAACYARSSERLYQWLLNHKWFGVYIRNWREYRAVSRRHKIYTISLLWITLILSALLATDRLLVRLILLGIGIGVSTFILRLKTLPPGLQQRKQSSGKHRHTDPT